MWWVPFACAEPFPAAFVVTGVQLPGGVPVELAIRDGLVVASGPTVEHVGPRVDFAGRFVVPAFIDSHVHLAYLPMGDEMLDGGVAGVLDLAAPLTRRPETPGMRTRWSGPMITSVGGYPVTSWGAGGYGAEVAGPAAARRAVEANADAGATVIKVPFEAPELDDPTLQAVVDEAHRRGLLVVAHALDDAGAARAAAFGVDGLAHTPLEPLAPATVDAWRHGFVISTLAAFGGGDAAVDNLRRLRSAGATVLYGTDFGNTSTPGIDPAEIEALRRAGLDGTAILEAATTAPATRWGFGELGALTPGHAASWLVLERDPSVDPSALGRGGEVFVDGQPRSR